MASTRGATAQIGQCRRSAQIAQTIVEQSDENLQRAESRIHRRAKAEEGGEKDDRHRDRQRARVDEPQQKGFQG